MFFIKQLYQQFKRRGCSPYDRPECHGCENLVDCLPSSKQCFDDLMIIRDSGNNIVPPTKEQKMFYGLHLMPCCGGLEFSPGPTGGMSMNISCCTCNQKWNICGPMQLIEKI